MVPRILISIFILSLVYSTKFSFPSNGIADVESLNLLHYSVNHTNIGSHKVSILLNCHGKEKSKTPNLEVQIMQHSKQVLQVLIKDSEGKAFELPKEEPFPYHKEENYIKDINTDYSFNIVEEPFSITVSRKSTKEVLFSTKGYQIAIIDNYAELTTALPSDHIYGLGERAATFKLKSGQYTLYNRDSYAEVDDGIGGGKNRYGSHPMYLMREKSGNYHISYLRNSFPMDVILNTNTKTLQYKIVGGVLDFTFFIGDKNPQTATNLYHKYLGGYILPPFWSMGFHQSRWGYKNLGMLQDVLKNYKKNDLPLDTIWMDIDYMNDFVPFTVDEDRFNVNEFKNTLATYKKKFVMIVEPAMGTKWESYNLLVQGKNLDIFVKNEKNEYLINRVWPGKCHFIDYFNPKAENYWGNAIEDLHQKLNFSGLWHDMNEIATFEWGQVNTDDQRIPCDDSIKYPYLPGGQPLERNTICPNAKHHKYRHVEIHNYYPNQQAMISYKRLEKMFPDQHPFILTRANAPGIGKYSFHWTGDNVGTFQFYKFSIAEVVAFNLYGGPMVGADICGFGLNTPEILCSKWYQMGSLYPFSRSHAHLDSYRKEPYKMGSTLLETTKKSLRFRYAILKHYYTLFITSKGEGAIFKPVFYEFFDDEKTLTDSVLENQFMIGSELLVVPNMNDNDYNTKVNAYFPLTNWFDLRYNTKVHVGDGSVTVDAVLNEMPPVFLRGGKTIFTNNVDKIENTYDLNNEFNILIALDTSNEKSYTSTGQILALGDYHSKKAVDHCAKSDCSIRIKAVYDVTSKQLSITFKRSISSSNDFTGFNITSFKIYGLNTKGLVIKETSLNNQVRDNGSKDWMSNSKYSFDIVNEDYCQFNIKGALTVEKKDVVIRVTFA